MTQAEQMEHIISIIKEATEPFTITNDMVGNALEYLYAKINHLEQQIDGRKAIVDFNYSLRDPSETRLLYNIVDGPAFVESLGMFYNIVDGEVDMLTPCGPAYNRYAIVDDTYGPVGPRLDCLYRMCGPGTAERIYVGTSQNTLIPITGDLISTPA